MGVGGGGFEERCEEMPVVSMRVWSVGERREGMAFSRENEESRYCVIWTRSEQESQSWPASSLGMGGKSELFESKESGIVVVNVGKSPIFSGRIQKKKEE